MAKLPQSFHLLQPEREKLIRLVIQQHFPLFLLDTTR